MKRKIFSVLFVLVLVLSLSLVTAVPVSAATLNVPSVSYPTIQSAIDAANPAGGDTILVAAGTYPEYLHITTDGLTIQGAGIDQSIIDLDGLTPYWHYPGNKSYASRAGVLISGYLSPGTPAEVVENVTFRGFTVKNAGLNPPITATGTHDGGDNAATLADSTASWTSDELKDQWVHNYGDRDTTDYKPARSYGQITANDATTVTATLSGGVENDWDIGDTYIITSYESYYDGWSDGQEDIPGIAIHNGKTVLIQDSKAENNGKYGISAGKARKTSLQQSENVTIDSCIAVDNADNGISVGDHTGTVIITNNTTLNNGSPHIPDPTREYQGVGIQVTGSKSSKVISGTIADNTVSNSFIGINLSKYIDGVTVEGNTVTGNNRDQDGAGIFFYYWGQPEDCKNITVRDNIVTGNIRGIVAYMASDSTIEGNTITTDSGTFPEGQAAIKIDNAYNITVENNSLSSLEGLGIELTASGSYNNTIGTCGNGNTIMGALGAGILIRSGAHDNTFAGNTITGTTNRTFTFYADWGTHDGGDNQVAVLTDSTATWTADAYVGMTVLNLTDGSSGTIADNDATTVTATLTGGTENDWDNGDDYDIVYQETQADGVFLRGGYCYAAGHAGTGNVFNGNYIFGNAGDGMENQITTTVNAENNWWGDASGPGPVGPGTGDTVSANVDYDPWLITIYTGETLFPADDGVAVELEATLTNSAGLTGLTVYFYVDNMLVGVGNETTVDGVYTLDIGTKDVGVYAVRAAAGCLEAEALIVVYDPTAGFVTGGGWIDSPEGAYTDEPSLVGKATFGFVSKYKKGATVPTGNTVFDFHVASLKFHSDTYHWLVVNQGGTNAQFKGTGTINGQGSYKFMLWAGDDDPDTFRIKIWTEENGVETVIYDNGSHQPIGGGNIVVHKAKK